MRLPFPIKLLPLFAFFLFSTIAVMHHSFFWDSITLGSFPANWFYENGFFTFLPDTIDTGHIPFFGVYLAIVWKIFGRSLEVSHFALLPFIWGSVLILYKIGLHFFEKHSWFPSLILIIAESTFISQSMLISSDVILVFFFLLSLLSILNKKSMGLTIGVVGLSLISLRGIFIAFALFLFSFLKEENVSYSIRFIYKKLLPFIPAVLIFVIYEVVHYQAKGWMLTREDSPWAENQKLADFSTFLRNIVILAWRLIDHGTIFQWLLVFYILLKISLKKVYSDPKFKLLLLLCCCILVCCAPFSLLFNNPIGHRYLLPFTISFSALTAYLLFTYVKELLYQRVIYSIVLIGMLSGIFWIYPGRSNGWDSTLGHLPYDGLRKDMILYLKEKNIPINETGSAFPNTAPGYFTDLNSDTLDFVSDSFTNVNYVINSNVFNASSRKDMNIIIENWHLEKEFRKGQVYLQLFRRPNF